MPYDKGVSQRQASGTAERRRVLLERRHQVGPRRAPRRGQAEGKRGDQRAGQGEEQHARLADGATRGRRWEVVAGQNRQEPFLALQSATRRPAKVATPARSTLSVSSCRTRRQRVAPMAARTAISRCRCSARTSSNPAASAQAMSSTRPTTPSNTHDIAWYCVPVSVPVTSCSTGTTPANGSRSRSGGGAMGRDGVELCLGLRHRDARLQPTDDLEP